MSKLTVDELDEVVREMMKYELDSPAVSVAPMGATVESEAPEAEAEPRVVQRRQLRIGPRPIAAYQFFTLDGNNFGFAVLVVLDCTFAYAIGKILGVW